MIFLKRKRSLNLISVLFLVIIVSCNTNNKPLAPLLALDFEDEISGPGIDSTDTMTFSKGIEGNGLSLDGIAGFSIPNAGDTLKFSNTRNFSISLWVKSESSDRDTTVILSNADFRMQPAGIYGQRRTNRGFTLYSHNGGWGWNIGNGRLNYLYDPITKDQPIADGSWHQLAFTYNSDLKEVRLYYDGINKAVIKTGDMDNRDFISSLPLRLGEDNKVSTSYKSFTGIIDDLKIWETTLSPEKLRNEHTNHRKLSKEPKLKGDQLTVLNWNIWHGGSHFTKENDGFDGIERITQLIKESGADIVLMQETYGAGSEISSSLGYYYYEAASTIGAVWGANLSVMSRYPMEEAYMVEERSNYGKNYAFNNGGVKIKLSKNKSVIAFSNWYNGRKPEDLEGALNAWKSLIDDSDNVPIVYGGDFNSVSHLDDGEGKSGHSKLMTEAGFSDSFREIYPDPEANPGFSGPGGYDRIDYIYYIGSGLELSNTLPILKGFKGRDAKHPRYPSDHLGIISIFKIK